MSSTKTLLTFDVDGTLIKSVGENANRFHKNAFSYGFKKIFGLDTTIDVVSHHGSTDKLIIRSVLAYHEISVRKLRTNSKTSPTHGRIRDRKHARCW